MGKLRNFGPWLLALVLVGCSANDDDGNGFEDVIEAETIDVDGLVLMQRDDGDTAAINLIDPTTGKASPFELPVIPRANGTSFSVSPDGHQVATVEPNGSVLVANVVIDAATDLPTFERVAYWEKVGETTIQFSFESGEWVGSKAIYDTNDGTRYPCEIRELDDLDSAHPRCRNAHVRAGALTTDLQFGWDLSHLPSASRLRRGVMQNTLTLRDGVQMKLPDGRLAILDSGINGEHVVCMATGWSTSCLTEFSPDLPGIVDAYDVPAAFENRRWDNEVLWDLSTVLRPFLDKGEGRRFTPLGFLQTGEVLYGISSWTISRTSIAGEAQFGVAEIKNSISENVMHTAVVAIDREGTTRAFEFERQKGGALPSFHNPIDGWQNMLAPLTHHGVVYFGESDWILPGGAGNWVGYLGGEKTVITHGGVISTDGHWMVISLPHDDTPPTLCFRPVKTQAARTCIPQATVGTPVSILAQGVRKKSGAPVVTTLSQPAAWPGATISIFGARFGDEGDLMLADTPIPADHIVEWSDHRVRFRTPDDMPEAGLLVVETSSGDNADKGSILYRSTLVKTPFDDLNHGPHAVGQGLNLVDLGTAEFDEPNIAGPVFISSQVKASTGENIIYAGAEQGAAYLRVDNGDFESEINFLIEDRLADSSLWQPVEKLLPNELLESKSYLTWLAGSLVEVPSRRHPIAAGERVVFTTIDQRGPGISALYGLPDYWREHEGTTYTLAGSAIRQLLGYGEESLELWGTPIFGDLSSSLGAGFGSFDFAGDTLIFAGNDNGMTGSAAYQFRTEGGTVAGSVFLASTETGRLNTLFQEPIKTEYQGSPAFIIFETALAIPERTHVVRPDGSLVQDIAGSPGVAPPYRPIASGPNMMIFAPKSATLVGLDLLATTPVWSAWPSESAAGHVASVYHDPGDGALYAVLDDGVVQRASEASGWTDWAPFSIDVQTMVDLKTTIRNLGRLPDGRWIVGADIAKPDGAKWVFADTAFFVSPEQN